MNSPSRRTCGALILALALTSAGLVCQDRPRTSDQTKVTKVNVNNADWQQIRKLPSVTDALAKKIFDKRPYENWDEFVKKAELPADVLSALKPLIVYDMHSPLDAVNVNTADWADIAALPGTDAAMASRIASRTPYKNWDEFAQKTEIPADVLIQIKPYVKFEDSMLDGRGVARQLNINKAEVSDVLALPGVDADLAKKIVKGKPYADYDEFVKSAGIPADLARKLEPLVKFEDSMLDGRGVARQLNINKAEISDLLALPGVDADLAKKIVKGKPYADYDEFVESAGIPADLARKLEPLVKFEDSMLDGRGVARQLNINKAEVSDVLALPGVDADLAKKIVKGKPYADYDEFVKSAGIPADLARKLEPLVKFEDSMVGDAGRGTGDFAQAPIDVNKSDIDAFVSLPDIGDALAARIVANRPYSDAEELAKVLPDHVEWKVMPSLTINGKPVWFGPAIDGHFTPGGSLEVVLHATSSGYAFQFDNVVLSDEGTATVRCTMTRPGAEEITNDMPENHLAGVERVRLGTSTHTVEIAVSTVQRGVKYRAQPPYVTVTSMPMPRGTGK